MTYYSHWISDYGYFGIFSLLLLGIVGLPVPDETLLVFSGYLIFRGDLLPIPTLIVSFLGSSCGISASYLLGRLLGRGIISEYGKWLGVSQERLEKVHDWFKTIGYWTLALGYFIPGARHLTAIAAGISKLESPIFMAYAYSGAFVWVSSFLLLGYYFGEDWRLVLRLLHKNLFLFSLIFAAFLLLLLAVGYWRKALRRGRDHQ
jgi:membrane protein DedA with SNARE-associated domain